MSRRLIAVLMSLAGLAMADMPYSRDRLVGAWLIDGSSTALVPDLGPWSAHAVPTNIAGFADGSPRFENGPLCGAHTPPVTVVATSSEWTVQAWARAAQVPTPLSDNNTSICVIVSQMRSGVYDGLILGVAFGNIYHPTGSILAGIGFNAGEFRVLPVNPMYDLRWHHLSTTWDGTRLTAYVDGLLVYASNTTLTTGGASATNLTIGGRGIFNDIRAGWPGWLRDVLIYTRAKGPDELKEDYTRTRR